MISRGLPIFESFCKLLRNVVTETFAEAAVKSNIDRYNQWTILPLYMCQISDSWLTCGFRLVSFTAQNLTSQSLPIFGSFCKLLRNVVTETFAEPSANREVSSNQILTGRQSGSFINVKLVIHCLMYGFRWRFPTCQFYLLTCCRHKSS